MRNFLIISVQKPELEKVNDDNVISCFGGASAKALKDTLLPNEKYEDVVLPIHRDKQIRQGEKDLIKSSVRNGSYIL